VIDVVAVEAQAQGMPVPAAGRDIDRIAAD
jgi:hypothetical protein